MGVWVGGWWRVVVVQTIEISPRLSRVEPACILVQDGGFEYQSHLVTCMRRLLPVATDPPAHVINRRIRLFHRLGVVGSPKVSTARLPAVLLPVILQRFTGRSFTGSPFRK